MSISDVLDLPAGTWLEAGFTGVVSDLQQKNSRKTQRPFWTFKVGDTDGAVEAETAIFTAPKFINGQVIVVTGRGIKYEGAGEYGHKISVGKNANWEVLGNSVHYEEQQERKSEGQPALNGDPFPVPGQTVGMAIKEALNLLTKGMDYDNLVDRLPEPTFWAAVHEVASDIVRVSRLLEKGKLAKSVRERNGGAADPIEADVPPAEEPEIAEPKPVPHPRQASHTQAPSRRNVQLTEDQAANRVDRKTGRVVDDENVPF